MRHLGDVTGFAVLSPSKVLLCMTLILRCSMHHVRQSASSGEPLDGRRYRVNCVTATVGAVSRHPLYIAPSARKLSKSLGFYSQRSGYNSCLGYVFGGLCLLSGLLKIEDLTSKDSWLSLFLAFLELNTYSHTCNSDAVQQQVL